MTYSFNLGSLIDFFPIRPILPVGALWFEDFHLASRWVDVRIVAVTKGVHLSVREMHNEQD